MLKGSDRKGKGGRFSNYKKLLAGGHVGQRVTTSKAKTNVNRIKFSVTQVICVASAQSSTSN